VVSAAAGIPLLVPITAQASSSAGNKPFPYLIARPLSQTAADQRSGRHFAGISVPDIATLHDTVAELVVGNNVRFTLLPVLAYIRVRWVATACPTVFSGVKAIQ